MVQCIVIVLLYVLGFGLLALVGGLSAAGDAFRTWGESVATRCRPAASRC